MLDYFFEGEFFVGVACGFAGLFAVGVDYGVVAAVVGRLDFAEEVALA